MGYLNVRVFTDGGKIFQKGITCPILPAELTVSVGPEKIFFSAPSAFQVEGEAPYVLTTTEHMPGWGKKFAADPNWREYHYAN